MSVFGEAPDHEQVVFCHDPATGLRAIIAIYSTALGPALGGTRFYPYADEQSALADVLRLSRAMAYKAACAGLPLGGGKAVILGDPHRDKTEAVLHAYGRFIDSLAGRYITACDVGTDSTDMAAIARESRHVTGRPADFGGAGDSTLQTAFGVFQGMRAAVEHTWGTPTLRGRQVGVAGAGKVGRRLIDHLLTDGAEVVVADVDHSAVEQLRTKHPEIAVVDPAKLAAFELDVYAPCALGSALTADIVENLECAVVCGGANNQLAHPDIADRLAERGITYAPDYVVNAGGLIQVAREVLGYDEDDARERTASIFETTRKVLEMADAKAITPADAADRIAEHQLAAAHRLRQVGRDHD